MNVLDRIRIERAVLAYDWWLDLRGTPWRRRRDLRSELRANLREAATISGARAAVAALGSTRQMAAEAVPDDPTRPRWTVGLHSGFGALVLTLLGALIAALAWADGVMSTDPDGPASGSITLLPGSSVEYAPVAEGFSVSYGVGWLPLAVAVAVFVAVARPWRAIGTRRAEQPVR
jgi:hypothetical protein